jgi:hypothetical protein
MARREAELISWDDYRYNTGYHLLRTIAFAAVLEQKIDWAFDGKCEQQC